MFYKTETIAMFIEGISLHNISRALDFRIDYKMLRHEFATKGILQRVSFYTAIPENEDDYTAVRPLVDWLSYNGYNVVSKVAREFVDDATQTRKIKNDLEVEITTDILTSANKVDHIVMFTGNGNYTYLVDILKRQGKRVTIASSVKANMVSSQLRQAADNFIEIDDLRPVISAKDFQNDNGGSK